MSMAHNRDTCASGFMLLLFTAVRKWNQPRHPSTNECIVNYAQLSKTNSQDKAYQWEILYSVRSPGVVVWMRILFVGSNIWAAGIQLVTLWAKVREALGGDPWLEKGSHWRRALSHSLLTQSYWVTVPISCFLCFLYADEHVICQVPAPAAMHFLPLGRPSPPCWTPSL